MYDWRRVLDSDHFLNPCDHIPIPFLHGSNEASDGGIIFFSAKQLKNAIILEILPFSRPMGSIPVAVSYFFLAAMTGMRSKKAKKWEHS